MARPERAASAPRVLPESNRRLNRFKQLQLHSVARLSLRSACAVFCATCVLLVLAAESVPSAALAREKNVLVFGADTPLRPSVNGGSERRRDFFLPQSAHVGENSWYLVRLRIMVSITRLTNSAPLIVSAAVNGLTSNRIEVLRKPNSDCNVHSVWNSVDLLRGFIQRQHCGPELTLASENFVQRNSIRPGPARLLIQAAGQSIPGDAVTILPGSGVYRTTRGPGRLEFMPFRSGSSLKPGYWTRLAFGLANRGDRTVRQIAVQVISSQGLKIKSMRVVLNGPLAPHSKKHGAFWIRAPHEGRFKLAVAASSTASHPGAELILVAGDRDSESSSLVRNLALAVALTGTCLLAYLTVRRRSSGGMGSSAGPQSSKQDPKENAQAKDCEEEE